MSTQTKAHAARNYFTDTILLDTDRVLDRATSLLADVDFDTFVVTGMSGAVAGGIFASYMGKNLFVIRKDDDQSTHDTRRHFGTLGKRWVFLDDLVDSGNTRARVIEYIKRGDEWWNGHQQWTYWDEEKRDDVPLDPEFVGTYVYAEKTWIPETNVWRGGKFTPAE